MRLLRNGVMEVRAGTGQVQMMNFHMKILPSGGMLQKVELMVRPQISLKQCQQIKILIV